MKFLAMLCIVLSCAVTIKVDAQVQSTLSLVSTRPGQIIPECVWAAHCDVIGNCVSGGGEGVGCDDSSGHCNGCFRGFTSEGGWFAVQVDSATGLVVIVNPGPLPDVHIGDQLRAVGAGSTRRLTNIRSGKWITRYTRLKPARSLRVRVYRPATGTWLTSTWKPPIK